MVRIILILLIVFPVGSLAQKQGKVEVTPRILIGEADKKCESLELGKVIFYHEPAFPQDMLGGFFDGSVEVVGHLDSGGSVDRIVKISGTSAFFDVAERAARKAKFSPTLCSGAAIESTVSMNYRFFAPRSFETYSIPIELNEIIDLETDDTLFPVISELQTKYGLIHVFPDGRFYEKAPLTRGEFAQFLKMTIDVLFEKNKTSGRSLNESGLVKTFNPKDLKNIAEVKDLEKRQPFYKAAGVLLQTYNISLADDQNRFRGRDSMTLNQVIDIWLQIFGNEAIPVNFRKTDEPREMTRGEFALFLNESMQVLSYKLLQ